jgi:hypothetical protein
MNGVPMRCVKRAIWQIPRSLALTPAWPDLTSFTGFSLEH